MCYDTWSGTIYPIGTLIISKPFNLGFVSLSQLMYQDTGSEYNISDRNTYNIETL